MYAFWSYASFYLMKVGYVHSKMHVSPYFCYYIFFYLSRNYKIKIGLLVLWILRKQTKILLTVKNSSENSEHCSFVYQPLANKWFIIKIKCIISKTFTFFFSAHLHIAWKAKQIISNNVFVLYILIKEWIKDTLYILNV